MITQMQVRKSDLTDIQLTQVPVPDLAEGEIKMGAPFAKYNQLGWSICAR